MRKKMLALLRSLGKPEYDAAAIDFTKAIVFMMGAQFKDDEATMAFVETAGGAVTVKMSVIPGTHRPSHTMVGEPPRSVVCSAEFDMSLADVNHLYERLFNAVLALNRSLNEIHNDP